MSIGRYRFVRSDNVTGKMSTKSLGTDAINAVMNWASAKADRGYNVINDDDELFVVELSWNEEVDTSTGSNLEDVCQKFGVDRSYEPA